MLQGDMDALPTTEFVTMLRSLTDLDSRPPGGSEPGGHARLSDPKSRRPSTAPLGLSLDGTSEGLLKIKKIEHRSLF